MRLHRLRITAFGPFGTTQDIDFDELSAAGLFLLHGPTGAGKTSVLDAVCYALYGSVPGPRQGGGQGATLRSDHASPDTRTEVRLELTVAGRRLEITRQPPWERPKKRGRRPSHTEHWTKVTVVLFDRQIVFLDRLGADDELAGSDMSLFHHDIMTDAALITFVNDRAMLLGKLLGPLLTFGASRAARRLLIEIDDDPVDSVYNEPGAGSQRY